MTTQSLTFSSFNEQSGLFQPSKQDKIFKSILSILLLVYLIFGIIVPFLEQVEIPREQKEQLPPQLAKILIEEKKLPEPVKPEPKPIEPEPEPEPEPVEKEPEPVKEKVIEPPKVPVKTTREQAKEKAQNSGLAAMKDDLYSMREAFDVQMASNANLDTAKTSETKVQRKLLAGVANTQSQAINAEQVQQTVSSDALSANATQQVRLAKEEVLATEGAAQQKQALASTQGQRSEAAIRRTLEANKARLYAMYNRALRKDPFLKGKVMFSIQIQPNGSISKVDIKSSELNNPKLERQLLLVLKAIEFPAEDVAAMNTIWAIDFLPA